jgi:hypothetical protein
MSKCKSKSIDDLIIECKKCGNELTIESSCNDDNAIFVCPNHFRVGVFFIGDKIK